MADKLLPNALSSVDGRLFPKRLLSDYTINRMIAFVQQVELELRGQYALTYTSTTPGCAAGKTIRLRAGSPDNRVQLRREAIEKPVGKR